MKILIVGAGAVGSLLGARLSAAGEAVQLVGRPEHVAAIRARGLRVEGTDAGTFYPEALLDVRAAATPDAVVLAVKTFGLPMAAAELAARFPALVPTLLPQNGLHIEGAVAGLLRTPRGEDPARWIVRAINSVPVTLVDAGIVRQAGEGELVLRDPDLPGPSSGAAAVFRAAFSRAGLRLRLVADLEREVWRKALVNAAINPVTALHRVPNGRLLDSPYREEARALLREAQQAAEVAGYPFSDEEADRDLDRVVRSTADNRSSMLQDRERGRPTEIDAILGEILRTARARGLDLPVTRSVIEGLAAALTVGKERAQSS
ncbi:MAG: 2-dehydropantoate 2-reductase [Thermoplasmata archaeon]